MIVYHGSEYKIEKPEYNVGQRAKDYGSGFYTTENIELAKEWACADKRDGFANQYGLSLEGLNVLRLISPEYNILNWLAILTRYRSYWERRSISERAKDYLQEHFFVDPTPYDIIIGYRADDSYFTFAQNFVAGTISLSKLSEAMNLGNLGEQIVLKSKRSFDNIRFIGAEQADAKTYYKRKSDRDREARRAYRNTRLQPEEDNELYMIDIIREGIENGDPRLL